MRIIVAGTRTLTDYEFVKENLDRLTRKLKEVIVVTGAAKGADELAERWAFKRMKTVIRYHADWKKYGKKAGPIRNSEMVNNADALIAFWNGKSPGTEDVIDKARIKGLKVRVILYEEE